MKITIPFGSLNHAIGYKAKNKKMLLEKYGSVMFSEGKDYCFEYE